MRHRSRWLGLAILVGMAAAWAWAQTPPPNPTTAAPPPGQWQVGDMKVSIWPEYDDPRVLVTYRGKIEGDVTLPVQIRFIVPRNADVTNTCALTPSGGHQCQLPRFADVPEGKEVRYSLPQRDFLMEFYYDPGFSGTTRDFSFDFVPTHPVRSLVVEVQKPLRATGFLVTPPADRTSTDPQGFQYQIRTIQNVQLGQSFTTQIRYDKPDTRPSVQREQAGMSEGGPGPTRANRSQNQTPLSVAVVLAGIFVVGLGVYWIRTSTNRNGSAPSKTKPVRKTGKGRFCPMCGERIEAGYKFCGNCGARLT